ncbi:MAG: hypothetical protein ACE5KV_08795 [Thermoplasmata archaeon]
MRKVREALEAFCKEFLRQPYLCYTEHGLHAHFYCLLWRRLSKDERYVRLNQKKVAIIQKEYPTAKPLDKSRRQHWDISIIKSPVPSVPQRTFLYDYLPLECAIEFGLNCTEEHLRDDIDRLSHPDSNVENGIIVHLYRLSEGISGRDLSPATGQLLSPNRIFELIRDTRLEAYYALFDGSGKHESSAWRVDKTGTHDLLRS